MAIYVPSKQRSPLLKKVIPSYADCCEEIFVMVEPPEWDSYNSVVDELRSEYNLPLMLLQLDACDQGVSYSRNACIRHAVARGTDVILFVDDDIRLTNAKLLLDFARKNTGVGGVAGYFATYEHFLQLPRGVGPRLFEQTLGQVAVAFRTEHLQEIGGYDVRQIRKNDYDVRIKLLLKGYPWFVHTDSEIHPVGKQYGEGGIKALNLDHDTVQKYAYDLLVSKYGDKFVRWTKVGNTHIRVEWMKWCKFVRETNADYARRIIEWETHGVCS